MDSEFYNAFATTRASSSDIAKNFNMENETGTMQKPPKLMGIEDYHGWKKRFENWVQANHLKSWESIETEYERPKNSVGVDKIISEFTEQERDSYKAKYEKAIEVNNSLYQRLTSPKPVTEKAIDTILKLF